MERPIPQEKVITASFVTECDCIAALEAEPMMVESNTALLTNIFGPRRAMVATTKIDDKVRGRPRPVMASFCPFCGAVYPALSGRTAFPPPKRGS